MRLKTDYAALDAAILTAIRAGNGTPLYNLGVHDIANPIAKATGREEFRVVDCRLQALRKSSVIEFDRKAGRWVEVDK